MTPQQLVQRREELTQTIRRAEEELTAIEGALGVYGARRSGRPRKASHYTDDEALKCWRLKRAGDLSPYVLAGAAQYSRDAKRRQRRREG